AVLGAVFSVAYSLRFLTAAFLGPQRPDYPHAPHEGGAGLWLPPLVLVVLVVLIGLAPQTMVGWLVAASATAVTGTPQAVHLALWHGVNTALLLSAVAVLGGLALLVLWRGLAVLVAGLPAWEAKSAYEGLVGLGSRGARDVTDWLTNGSMGRALAVLCLVIVAGGALAFASGEAGPEVRPMLPVPPVVLAGWIMAMIATG